MRSICGNGVVNAVVKSIVKSVDTLRLVRHARTIFREGDTVGLVARIFQIEVSRPDIAIYHVHTSAIFLLE